MKKALRARAADISREGLTLALILATLGGEDAFSYYPNLKGRQILIRNLMDNVSDIASFYTQRVVSVEIGLSAQLDWIGLD